MQADPQSLHVLVLLAVMGALLGGAVGHWRRGRSMILTGAIIGMIVLPLLAIGAAMASGVIAILVIAGVVLSILGAIFAG